MNKKMDICEFRKVGYLQEVNRQFFHPLGLALAVTHDTQASECQLFCIYVTEDPEGFIFDDLTPEDVDRGLAIARTRANLARVRGRMVSPRCSPVTGVQYLTEKESDG